ncbi:MAG: PPC domain-containing DNA-binding protein [Gemmatimonadaceae bacterium]
MQAKEIDKADGRRTFALVFDIGDEVANGLLIFAREQDLRGAYFTAIGALQDATLGFWDGKTREYRRIPVHEQVEVLSLAGNIAIGAEGELKVHAHIIVGKADGSAHGGHLRVAPPRVELTPFDQQLACHGGAEVTPGS